jgi:hypothetical protein
MTPDTSPSIPQDLSTLELPMLRQSLLIPVPNRIPEVNTIHDAIRYWEKGAPEKGLVVPLKDWRDTYEPWQWRTQGQKFSMIEKVYLEYSVHCEGDMDVFSEQYPGLENRYTKLLSAVREARILRGETKARRKKDRPTT